MGKKRIIKQGGGASEEDDKIECDDCCKEWIIYGKMKIDLEKN